MPGEQPDMRPVREAERRAHLVADRSRELFLAVLDLGLIARSSVSRSSLLVWLKLSSMPRGLTALSTSAAVPKLM